MSLSHSNDKNEAAANTENGYLDRFDELKIKNKTNDGMQSKDFMTTTNLDKQSGTTKFTGSGTTLEDLEAYYEGSSRQRGTAQV